MMDMEWLRRLIRLVEESDIDSLEVERWTTRVRIRKTPTGTAFQAMPASAPEPGPAAIPAPEAATSVDEPAEEAPSNLHEIHSPMVGTFYRAPSPEADPYVEVGDRVERGQTLCILEAMKLMNELEAEVEGVLREIVVQDAEPVEYGQVLFRVEPA